MSLLLISVQLFAWNDLRLKIVETLSVKITYIVEHFTAIHDYIYVTPVSNRPLQTLLFKRSIDRNICFSYCTEPKHFFIAVCYCSLFHNFVAL